MAINETSDSRILGLLSSNGNTVWYVPTATQTMEFPLLSGGLFFGSIGAGTAITLLTIAHAVMAGGKRRRRKRDVSLETAALHDRAVPEFGDETFHTDFDDIYHSDSNWCGLRLTCELAARAGSVLDEDEKMILSYFKGVVSAEDLKTLEPPEIYYSYASFIGFTSGDLDKCADAYGKCPYSGKKMMSVYKSASDVKKRKDNNNFDDQLRQKDNHYKDYQYVDEEEEDYYYYEDYHHNGINNNKHHHVNRHAPRYQ